MKAVRALVKKTAADCEEYVSPWKTPAFDSNGPLCVFVLGKEHVTLGIFAGAMLADPEKLLEGKAKGVRNVRLRESGGCEAAGSEEVDCGSGELNKKDPPSGKMVGDE